MWWRSWLRHCAKSRKVAGSIPDGVTGILNWHNPSGRTMALGSTQPLTEMSPSTYRFQNAFLRCPTPRLHCFLSSHWPSLRFLLFMAFLIPSIQFFFSLPCALFCFGIHFNAILGNLPSTILWTWPYHVSSFYSIYFTIVSSSPICCLTVTFIILCFLDIL